MAQAPNWCKDAKMVVNGWQDPNTGELLVSGRFTQAECDAYNGVDPIVEQVQVPETVQTLTEAPVGDKSLEEMSKIELEALGRQHGVELDRRKKKSTLVERMTGILNN